VEVLKEKKRPEEALEKKEGELKKSEKIKCWRKGSTSSERA